MNTKILAGAVWLIGILAAGFKAKYPQYDTIVDTVTSILTGGSLTALAVLPSIFAKKG